jgi:hypothetical protein
MKALYGREISSCKHFIYNFFMFVAANYVSVDKSVAKLMEKYIDKGSLQTTINSVQNLDPRLKPAAYKRLFEKITEKNHNEEPEILLLQKKIGMLEEQGTAVLDETKKQVDADCRLIISRIVKEIKQKENYPISIYIANSIDRALLDDNMATIVHKFYNGTSKTTLLLIQCFMKLPNIPNKCSMIDALLKELEKSKLLESKSAMHLWACAQFMQEESKCPDQEEISENICTEAIEKLSLNKKHFFRHYRKYVKNSDKQKIADLHDKNPCLQSIVRRFVSFYYNGDVDRTQNMLAAANAIPDLVSVGRILSQLREEMAKSGQLNSFEAFRILHIGKRKMNSSAFKSLPLAEKDMFKQLKEKAAASFQDLLILCDISEFSLVNTLKGNPLFFTIGTNDNAAVGCWAPRQESDDHQLWKIVIDEETSLLSIRPKTETDGELGVKQDGTLGIVETFRCWKINAVDGDDHHVVLYTDEGDYHFFFQCISALYFRY